jgi:phosphoribosylformylglycinamidine synthase subunit PurL
MALSENDIKEIKKILKRTPTNLEYYIFDTMWSEHCSYKSSKSVLRQLPTKADTVALGIGEDAGIVRFLNHEGKQYCVAISHESHNHPSQILPIEGAATGVGGCVRDVYCMGADVIGVLNSLHFGINKDKSNPITEEIEKKVIQGIADYGNPLGVPVLGGETLYHESYNDNCLVNVAAIGLICEDDIVHSYVPDEAKTSPYDIILFGKSTDATGFGGASFSSATLDDENHEVNVGAVQVHDPFLKRVLVESIKKMLAYVKEHNIAIGFKDLGAGGISCATSEIAIANGFGVQIDLDKVNVAHENLKPEVIACSETQERFCLAVPRQYSKQICDIFNVDFSIPTLYPNGGAVVIGEVTTDTNYIISSNGNSLCNLPIESITTEVKAPKTAKTRKINLDIPKEIKLKPNFSIKEICNNMITKKINASKRYVYRCFDNAVRGATVTYPGEADAVVVKPIKTSNVGLAVSMDSNLYGKNDPYISGAAAVAESIRNVIAVGAEPISITDCLNYGNPEKGDVFFDFEEGVRGISEAANKLSFSNDNPIPIISGNVSFYNESKQGNAVIASPVICTVGRVDDISNSKCMQVFESGLDLILIGKRYSEFSGTQVIELLVSDEHVAPQVRFEDEKCQNKAVLELYKKNLVEACHDISFGGLWLTLLEMLFGERGTINVGIESKIITNDSILATLFSENAGYVVATKDLETTKVILDNLNVDYNYIGKTVSSKTLSVSVNDSLFNFDLPSLVKNWNAFNS